MNKFLTIVIPTYNREKRLIRLLKSIERQNAVDKYFIVILNNHSDYNVEELISKYFSGSFLNNVEIINRPYNIGAENNIGSAFLYAKTDFLWIIGDDDEVIDGCFNIIEEDSIRYSDIPFFKYPSNVQQKSESDILVSNIKQFKELNRKGLITAGNVIFVSNNIFNLPQLVQYISTSLLFSYSSIPHSLPMLRCLMDKRPFLLSNREIVRYLEPDGDHWNYIKIVMRLSTVLNIDDGDHNVVREFFRIISQHFNLSTFLQDCIKLTDKSYRQHVCRIGMEYVFADLSCNERLLYLMYKVENATGFKVFSKYIIVKSKVKDKLKIKPFCSSTK